MSCPFQRNTKTNHMAIKNTTKKEIVIEPAQEPTTGKNETTSVKDGKQKQIKFVLYRRSGQTFFEFDIAPEIEKIYQSQEHTVRESKNWEGLKFYFIPNLTENEMYRKLLNQYRLFDDYGQGLYKSGWLNIAWVRTVGGKGIIAIKEPLTFAELAVLIRNTTQFLREYFNEYFKEFKIRGTVSIDV